MSAFFKRRFIRGAHARIAAEEQRSGGKVALLVLVIVFVALVAILLRLAEFAGRPIRRASPPPPAAAVIELLEGLAPTTFVAVN